MKQYRWYGWGGAEKTYSLEDRPGAWKFLCSTLNLNGNERYPPCDFDQIELPPSRIDLQDVSRIAHTDTTKYIRILHGYGKSYRDLIRLRRGEIFNPPDAVIYPDDEAQVIQIIQYCAENNYAIIPFGGGSSLVGGVEPRDHRITLSLDLKKLNRVIAIDQISQTALIESGIWGPELESYLNARGFTLGHFPPSFEFSTLGGWIATRGSGLTATKYGAIDQMTLGLRLATPSGMIETRLIPARVGGLALLQMLIGSEGTLGVITRATMRIQALSKIANCRAMMFRNFADGVAAMRAIVQSDVNPAVIQLLDEDETSSFFAFRKRAHGVKDFFETTERRAWNVLGYSFEQGALLMLGFEGDAYTVKTAENHVLALCQTHGAFEIGSSIARDWFADRYESPYLRDALIDHGVMMDTLETATSWGNLELLYMRLTQTIRQAIQEIGHCPFVMTHIAHCSHDGASICVTFFSSITPHHEMKHWAHIQRAAIECIVDHGGTLSHHHGFGYEYAPWVQHELGALEYDALVSLKHRLDPQNIMNPGKLFGQL